MSALDGLAVRFSILLAIALLAANLIAAVLLYTDRARQSSAWLIEREVERIVSLVPAIEASPAARRRDAAREASTRVSRVSLDPAPIVEEVPRAPRSARLTRQLSAALGGRDVRAAILVRGAPERGQGRVTVALSIPVQTQAGPPQWLNSVSRGGRGAPPGLPAGVLLVGFSLSLVAVLGVALLVVRRLTRPLNALARAARQAGDGDRTARVSETGPREVRAAAAAFNEMQARIAQFDAERMRMLAAVGHDLRTPITSLRIRAEMLDDAAGDAMVRTLDEMTVMADGLVAYARGAGEGEAAERVDLADLLVRLSAERGATCDVSEPVTLQGRPVALRRAFGNLIDNALRYGGTARVRMSRDGAHALVTVDDDGPGIPAEAQAEMFAPFVRGEVSRNSETGGAGLGLAIVQTVIVAHGGTVVLENRSEGGLRATVRLPLAASG